MRTILVTALVLLFSPGGSNVFSQTGGCDVAGDTVNTSWAGLSPAMVWAGTEYGVAWDDDEQIYFGRLDSAGNPIGTLIRISTGDGWKRHPSIAWTGSGYGVTWWDRRHGDREIFFALLDADGNNVGKNIRVTDVPGSSYHPRIVWTGTEFGIAWFDLRGGDREIYFTRLDANGVEIGDDIRVTDVPEDSDYPMLAWTGTEYAIAWSDARDGNFEIYFTRLDPQGNKIGGDIRITNDPGESDLPGLAWTGSGYGVLWNDDRGTNPGVWFARLDGAGNKIGAVTQVTNVWPDSLALSDALTWSGSEFAFAWTDMRQFDGDGEIYFTRLDATGNKIGDDVQVSYVPGASWLPVAVWNGADFGVVWSDDSGEPYEYGLHFRPVACGPADSDGDGIPDDVDACPDTVVPEGVPTIRLGVNRWALVDDDDIFDTTPPPGGGNGPGFAFTLADTMGCSCEQIIEELGLGQGHVKFGCSTEAILAWTGLGDDEGDDESDDEGSKLTEPSIFERNWPYPESVIEPRREIGGR